MKWSSDIIDQIRQAHDIVEWIGRDTMLKSNSSNQYTGLCPFPDHKEKTPSFSVSSVKQVYHCFGCQKGGDIFTYFQDQKGMSFSEAVRYLANQAGISLDETNAQKTMTSVHNRIFSINEDVANFYHQTLLKISSNHPAKRYLQNRGYSDDIIRKFQIGYAPRRGELLRCFHKENQKQDLHLAQLLREKNSSVYEFFHHRLMFPIRSPINQVIGFGARTLDQSLPKYINSRDSSCFQKRKIFYGLNQSASFIRKSGYVLVVEGYTDFLTLFQNGFCHSVATLGVALTTDHAKLLKRYTDKVVLFFDGDQAGEQATLRSLPLLLEQGLKVYRAELKGMDPDECITQKGVDFLKNIIRQHQDLFLNLFYQKLKNETNVEKHLEIAQEMAPILHHTKNKILKEYYQQRMLDVFTPSDQKSALMIFEEKSKHTSFAPSVKSFDSGSSLKSKTKEESKKLRLTELAKHELYLLVLCLHQNIYWEHIRSKLNLKMLLNTPLQKIFDIILQNDEQNPSIFDSLLAKVTRWVEPEIGLQIQNYPALISLTEDEGIVLIDSCLRRLTENYENSRIRQLTMQLRLDQKNKIKYLEEIKNIKKNLLSTEHPYEK